MATVLLVDDERSIRVALAEILRGAGYTVSVAADATEALQVFARERPDVVVSDIILPTINGMELIQLLRQQDPFVQVIIMTGEPTLQTAADAVRVGAVDYLMKPIGKADLVRVVGTAARMKAMDDERRRLEAANEQYRLQLEDLVDERTKNLHDVVGRLRVMLEGLSRAMAIMVETRDGSNSGHQERVAELSRVIAKEIRLPIERIMGVYLAALVHDIGILRVPVEILRKPSRLSPEEFEIVKRHPQSAYDLLKPIPFDWPVADIVLQHHERYDGSGYPQGLTGALMLPESAVVAVADVVEAMISPRPYRPAFSLDRALSEIVAQRGKQFDPAAVDACVRVFETKRFAFE